MTDLVIGIDPGTTQTGWAVLADGHVSDSGVLQNDDVLRNIMSYGAGGYRLAIERFEARGMPMSEDSIATVIWTGRFQQAWHDPSAVDMVKRSRVKLALCGSNRAKDPNVRQALIDLLGPPGTKKAPGPTYGVASHAWAALAVAVVSAGMVSA